ncbi:MAG TPA: HlyD family efflux transporter periplasmic adaptor subunit [Verrucomicrobiales bacterium]|nr:HlyD family efflux transporter periplasmic adaptor subunit [Verrucomicrobiales bacterium]HIL70245.1 HlyD family efflux transporter periplasmic adaptor subunit [Verrucomicrobiota bacterium]
MDSQEQNNSSVSETSAEHEKSNTGRRIPSFLESLWVLTLTDLRAMLGSWLCRGFLLVSCLLTVLALKGMQSDEIVAAQMLEVVYVTYLLVWMHGVIFISGGALAREYDCLNDAILSRGVTRGEYIVGKLLSRGFGVFLMIGSVLLPASFWSIRQDELVRTEVGQVASKARNTIVEAWEPKKVFTATNGRILESKVEEGTAVKAGDLLAQLDDRELFDHLEMERRNEEDARNRVNNSKRQYETSQRAISRAADALEKAERSLVAKDLLSRFEQANRESDMRNRKMELKDAENQTLISKNLIIETERAVESALARVREARKRLGHATITSPISGYLTEVLVEAGQPLALGAHLFTIASLDEYQLDVPIYNFKEFKRLKEGYDAYINIQGTEFTGNIERIGATTKKDRWGKNSNFVIVRFKGDSTKGLLGLDADVRLALPPKEGEKNMAAEIMDTLTGRGKDDLESRTASVTTGWMLIGLGKVMGCALMLVSLTLFAVVIFRSQLIAILGVTGLWHISNLIFDFSGLPELSYLEMVRTMDKVLGGVAIPAEEFTTLAWLALFIVIPTIFTVVVFVSRDPEK